MAVSAGIITLVGSLIIFAITRWLIGSTSQVESGEGVTQKIYGLRKTYFIFLSILIAVTLFGSLRGLPYYPPDEAEPTFQVAVTGRMWSWEISGITNLQTQEEATRLPKGSLVEFLVEAEDVNHGIGIYDESGQILTQTQAMPGYPARVYHRFEHPGTYQVVCMEYCGVGHHVMNTSFQVQ